MKSRMHGSFRKYRSILLAGFGVVLVAGCGTSTRPDPGPPPCPVIDRVEVVGRVVSPEIREVSGLVASRTQPDVLWVHNDSGDLPRLFAIHTDGSLRGTFLLEATARDWEDMAIGPGPRRGQQYLYLADIGDNFSQRDSIQIHRFAEPVVDGANHQIAASEIVTMDLTYPDGAHDAETLLVDPETGDLLIVIKTLYAPGPSLVYRLSAEAQARGDTVLELVGEANLEGGDFTTGGDISPDGREILVRGYVGARLWRRTRRQSVAEALAGEPCEVPVVGVPEEPQGEAIGFSPDGESYLTLSEGLDQPIYQYSR